MSLSPYTRIPDTPNIGDYIASNCNPLSARPSNSVLDWAPKLGQDLRRRIVLDTELYELENDTDTVTGAQSTAQCHQHYVLTGLNVTAIVLIVVT